MTGLEDIRRHKNNLRNKDRLKRICDSMELVLSDINAGKVPEQGIVEDNIQICKELYVLICLEEAKYNYEQRKAQIKYEIECPKCRSTYRFHTDSCRKCHYTFSKEELNDAEMQFRSKKIRENNSYKEAKQEIRKMMTYKTE